MAKLVLHKTRIGKINTKWLFKLKTKVVVNRNQLKILIYRCNFQRQSFDNNGTFS